MKIRVDFVTNSSSSSFVIAKKKDCTKADIETYLNGDTKFKEFVENNCEYICIPDEYTEEYGESYFEDESISLEEKVNMAKTILIGEIETMGSSLELDDWDIHCCEISSETDNIFGLYFYMNTNPDTDKIKTGWES